MKIKRLKDDFPIMNQIVNGHPLSYLDSAASTQKPKSVIDAIHDFYSESYSNIHRSVHTLSAKATELFEESRLTVQKFINAEEPAQCIFVKSTTEGINLVASSFGAFIGEQDEIIISMMEHHANIVPWQMLRQRTGCTLKFIPMNKEGELLIEELDELITSNTKLIAVQTISNVFGTIHPVKTIIQKAHAKNIPVLLDAAQMAGHLPIDVQDLNCDFLVFSGHKAYGPTGIGVLYGKKEWLEKMPPYQGGGEMIKKVSLYETTFQDLPHKFEAGTQSLSGAIGLGVALKYLQHVGFKNIHTHEVSLLLEAKHALSELKDLEWVGNPKERIGILSFNLKGIHPHDIGTIADQFGVALRTGHHCAMPTLNYLNVPATVRISFGMYNRSEDINQLILALKHAKSIFKIKSKTNVE